MSWSLRKLISRKSAQSAAIEVEKKENEGAPPAPGDALSPQQAREKNTVVEQARQEGTSPEDVPLADMPQAGETATAEFAALGLQAALVQGLAQGKYRRPTPVQRAAIPQLLARRDIFASSGTGTGKTAAFLLPALQLLSTPATQTTRGPRLLVLTPTRELAAQVKHMTDKYSASLRRIKVIGIVGGMPYVYQHRLLSSPYEVLVATPGRLGDLMKRGRLGMDRLEMLVLDEADRMLDLGFRDEILQLISAMPSTRTTALFSATLDDPQVLALAARILRDPVHIQIADAAARQEQIVERLYYADNTDHKIRLLDRLLGTNSPPVVDTAENLLPTDKTRTEELINESADEQPVAETNAAEPSPLHPSDNPSAIEGQRIDGQAIIFTNTRSHAESLVDRLRALGKNVTLLHGEMPQPERTRAVEQLKLGEVRALVATDLAGRGLHFEGLGHIVHFEIPRTPEEYIHRVGRTGRAGNSGVAIALACKHEIQPLRRIEKHLGRRLAIFQISGLEPSYQPPVPRSGRVTLRDAQTGESSRMDSTLVGNKLSRQQQGSKGKRRGKGEQTDSSRVYPSAYHPSSYQAGLHHPAYTSSILGSRHAAGEEVEGNLADGNRIDGNRADTHPNARTSQGKTRGMLSPLGTRAPSIKSGGRHRAGGVGPARSRDDDWNSGDPLAYRPRSRKRVMVEVEVRTRRPQIGGGALLSALAPNTRAGENPPPHDRITEKAPASATATVGAPPPPIFAPDPSPHSAPPLRETLSSPETVSASAPSSSLPAVPPSGAPPKTTGEVQTEPKSRDSGSTDATFPLPLRPYSTRKYTLIDGPQDDARDNGPVMPGHHIAGKRGRKRRGSQASETAAPPLETDASLYHSQPQMTAHSSPTMGTARKPSRGASRRGKVKSGQAAAVPVPASSTGEKNRRTPHTTTPRRRAKKPATTGNV